MIYLFNCSCETVTGIMFVILSGESLPGEDVGLELKDKVWDGFSWGVLK